MHVRMRRPYISIIIPAFNANERLCELVRYICASRYKNIEVVIGDDASNEQITVAFLIQNIKKNIFPLRIIRLTRNKGPAAARNIAVKRAKGDVLVFLDSDVTVYPDTIEKIADKFKEDRDLTALTGVWYKHQNTKSFFPQFKALRDWSYWTNERDRDGYYYLFSTRIAAIRREVFVRLGGFNDAFRQMEDVELTYRIAKRYAIIFAADVRVHHEFEEFWVVAFKYFWRSFYWTKLYKERRKFDQVATTVWESMAGVTGASTMGFLALGFLSAGAFILSSLAVRLFHQLSIINYQLSMLFFIFHIILLWKFLRFVVREKGWLFMVKSLMTGILLYCFVAAGAGYYYIKQAAS